MSVQGDASRGPSEIARGDRDRVLEIVDLLQEAGLRIWVDRNKIPGGTNYGEMIVSAIKNCKVLILMCSTASMRSRNVKQEIQLAWKYEKPFLPLLLEQINFPEQVEYWLEGWQWIEILDHPINKRLLQISQALKCVGIQCQSIDESIVKVDSAAATVIPDKGLDGLRAIAKFTDQIWPLPADRTNRGLVAPVRGLGAPQNNVKHGFKLGSRICVAIESIRKGHLLLLDEGQEKIVYCLCPSWFAPDTQILPGRNVLPQKKSQYDSFVITGKPGREQLLAIITDKPLGLDWVPVDKKVPARVLNRGDIDTLLTKLRNLEGDKWTALSTYFDVLA